MMKTVREKTRVLLIVRKSTVNFICAKESVHTILSNNVGLQTICSNIYDFLTTTECSDWKHEAICQISHKKGMRLSGYRILILKI